MKKKIALAKSQVLNCHMCLVAIILDNAMENISFLEYWLVVIYK